MHSSPSHLRTLLLTMLAGGLGFAAGSWRHARHREMTSTPSQIEAPSTTVGAPPPAISSPSTAPDAPSGEPKPIRERLKDLARARNPLAAAAEAQALIATLTAEDFRNLATQPKEFPFPYSSPGEGGLYSRAYMDALVRRWLEVDPEGAAAAMRALDEALVMKREGNRTSSWMGRGLLTDSLARLQPTPPTKLAEALASGAQQWRDDSAAAEKTFEELGRIDPARALALAERIPDKTGQLMAQMAVRKAGMNALDPVEAARTSKDSLTTSEAFARAASEGPERLRAAIVASIFKLIDTTTIVAEGVIRDPDKAWHTLPSELAGRPDRFNAGAVRTTALLARELPPADRERALATADKLSLEWRKAALEPLVGAWALDNPQAAMEWVAQKGERSDAAFAALGPWMVSEADAAVAWVEKSASPEVRQALAGQLARTFEAGEKARQSSGPMATLNQAPAEARSTAAALLDHSPAEAARLVAELPRAELANTAFQPIFEKWLDRDAAAAAQWLESFPASRRRDEAVAAFAAAAAPRDAEGAAQWVTTIADAALRQRAADSVFRAMELRDPAAARAWRDSLAPPP